MTIEEAIGIARTTMLVRFKNWKAIKTLINCAEKQIPKKLIHNGTENFVRDNCPTCGHLFGIMTWVFAYCPDCGQAINWEDEDE